MWLIAAAEVRQRRAVIAVIAVLTAVWVGMAAAAAAGARRTESAVTRFERRTAASAGTISTAAVSPESDLALRQALDARPEVVASDSVWGAMTGIDEDVQVLLSAADGVSGDTFDRPIVLEGRLADPGRADEVVVTTATAGLLGLEVGDELAVPTFDEADWAAWLPVRGAFPPFDGPRPTMTVVGIVRLATDLTGVSEEAFRIVATPAFRDRWEDQIGDLGSEVVVTLTDGTDLDAIVGELEAELGFTISGRSTREALAPLRGATGALSSGLWALAGGVGVTGGVVLALAIGSQLQRSTDRQRTLSALGLTRPQRTTATVAPFAVALAIGAVAGAAGSVIASPRFPIGRGRLADPRPAVHVDWPLLGASLAAVLVVLATAVAIGTRAATPRPATALPRQPNLAWADRLGAAVALGVAGTCAPRVRRSAVPIMALTIAGLVAVTSFAASTSALGREPSRWGYTWSSSPELGFTADGFDSAVDETMRTGEVAGITTVAHNRGSINGQPFAIATFFVEAGSAPAVKVFSGRVPARPGEIALGKGPARALDVGVGDRVAVGSSTRPPEPYVVVGIVVPPAQDTEAIPGDGALVDSRAYLEFANDDGRRIAITYQPDVDADAVEAALASDPGWVFDARSHAVAPGGVANPLGTRVILPWLGGFFLVLGVGASVLAVARRGRRRDLELGVLRAMGMTRIDLLRLAGAEAAALVLLACAIGLAVGIRVDIGVWSAVIGDLGIDDHQASRVVPVLAAVAAVAVPTFLASSSTARHAGQSPGSWLPADGRDR